MNAYSPVYDTMRPNTGTLARLGAWTLATLTQTQTVFQFAIPATERRRTASSLGKPTATFEVAKHPTTAGLERLRKFGGWADNWDAEGAKAPQMETLDFATQVFGLLSTYYVPDVTLSVDGHPMFIYGGKLRGEIIVTGSNTFDYFFDDEKAPEGEDVTLSHGKLPDALISYVSSAG